MAEGGSKLPGRNAGTKGVQRILIEADAIQQRVRELAAELDEIYSRRDSAAHWGAHRRGHFHDRFDAGDELRTEDRFHGCLSYGDDVTSSGAVRILKDLNENIEDRIVLIVEDIVDSGLTLKYLLDVLQRRKPGD